MTIEEYHHKLELAYAQGPEAVRAFMLKVRTMILTEAATQTPTTPSPSAPPSTPRRQ